MESEINKEFIFNHFARKTSPLQRELIAHWLRQRANEERYYEWLEEWENNHPQYLTRSEPAYQHYSAFLHENQQSEAVDSSPFSAGRRNWSRRQWLIAASVLLCLASFTFLVRNQLFYRTYETTFGETRSLRLPDGSAVVLKANSSLRLPRWGFGHRTREVWLAGEAGFSVTHTPSNQRFIVKTEKNFEVVVLGTEFTVFARKRGTRVALNRGRVQLQYREGSMARQLVMKPGQMVSLDPANRVARNVTKRPDVQPAWGDKRFVFDETPLREVALMLEESYGLSVRISDPELADRVLIGSLRAENADQLLQSISELLDINVVRQGNRVLLRSH